MSGLVALVISACVSFGSLAFATTFEHPSGFRPEECEHLLDDGAPAVPSLAKFKRLDVREKIRDVHAMAHLLYFATRQAGYDRVHVTASALLASDGLSTLWPRLAHARALPDSVLRPYARELVDIAVKLSVLVTMADELDERLNVELAAFTARALELPAADGDRDQHHRRALAYLSLALLESEAAKHAPSATHAFTEALAFLDQVAREDAAGYGCGVVLGGLTQLMENVALASLDMDDADLASVDRLFAEVLRRELDPFAGNAPRPSHHADAMEGLGSVSPLVQADRLPRLRQVFDEYAGAAPPASPPRRLN